MTPPPFFLSRYLPPDPKGSPGGGGLHRALQIREMLDPLGVKTLGQEALHTRAWRLLPWRLKHRLIPGHTRGMELAPHSLRNWCRLLSRAWIRHLAPNPPSRLIVEDPVLHPELLDWAERREIPVAGLPQNLLSPDLDLPLPQELWALERCALRLPIASAEALALDSWNLPGILLPYAPPSVLTRRLQDLRRQRSRQSTFHGILALGTTLQEATREGLLQVAQSWEGPQTLHLVGRGTHTLPLPPGSRVVLHGFLEQATLDRLLTSCHCALVPQPRGRGILTRIPELLAVGIPVLADPHAARDADHLQAAGLHIAPPDEWPALLPHIQPNPRNRLHPTPHPELDQGLSTLLDFIRSGGRS